MRGDSMKTSFKLQILQTSDVHGYVYPTSYSTRKEEPIGLAKVSTLLQNIRQKNSILIDTGDTIQGSPLTYHYAKNGNDGVHPMAKVMNHMKYDYVTIGNHEFNYGLDVLNSYLDHVDATILNSNILQQDQTPYKGVAYDIIEPVDGCKLAIIGVTTHYIPNWEQPSHIESIQFNDAFETTKQLVQDLTDTVDIIVVSYHGGFERNFDTWALDVEDTGENQGSKMLAEIEGIDLLLTGHQHRLLTGRIHNTNYVQPGYNANHLSETILSATYDNCWTVEMSSTLHDVTSVTPDASILALLQEEEQATQEYLDTPVGFLDHDQLITDQLQARLHKHPLVTFINQVQLDFTKADIALSSLGNNVSGFAKQITIRDIIGTYIYPNTIVVKEMTASEIKKALEKSAEFFTIKEDMIQIADLYNTPKLQLYAYDMYDPLEYTITISKPIGSRVSNIRLNGSELDPTKRYKVAMNNYRASGGGDYFFIKECPTYLDTQTEVIELLIDYIITKKHITLPKRQNITIKR